VLANLPDCQPPAAWDPGRRRARRRPGVIAKLQ
jgi:hypothetical protein